MHNPIPLALYVHLPWCIQKCPYCDFNSHALRDALPEEVYIQTLIKDLEQDIPFTQNRPVHSVFLGGGTPSLFAPHTIYTLLQQIKIRLPLTDDVEITMEANPGTLTAEKCAGFHQAGINRLSIGIQSFDNKKLKVLGRIHDSDTAVNAFHHATRAGFDNINIDIMYGLPEQTLNDALQDLKRAIALNPQHISWYQLTLEPNTPFYAKPPPLPPHDDMYAMQCQGQALLHDAGYLQYETSGYARPGYQCRHNLNYWLFGDYLGVGAGAHGKLTDFQQKKITRTYKIKHPKHYLKADCYIAEKKEISEKERPLEFMMNALRLVQPIPNNYFETRTLMPLDCIAHTLEKLASDDFLTVEKNDIAVTKKGQLFLNDLLSYFVA